MKLQAKDEYLARVENIYYLAVESVLAEREKAQKEWMRHPLNEPEAHPPFLLGGAIEKRFIELVAVDMHQQVENTSKSYDRKMAEVKAQLDKVLVPIQPKPTESVTQKLVEGLCGEPINAQEN